MELSNLQFIHEHVTSHSCLFQVTEEAAFAALEQAFEAETIRFLATMENLPDYLNMNTSHTFHKASKCGCSFCSASTLRAVRCGAIAVQEVDEPLPSRKRTSLIAELFSEEPLGPLGTVSSQT